MNKILYIFLFSIVYFISTICTSAQSGDINNKVHKVVAGETIYSIAKTNHISQIDLIEANPILSNGLKIGEEIVIPEGNYSSPDPRKKKKKKKKKKEQNDKPAEKANVEKYIYYTVKPQETIYGIAKQFFVTPEEIIKHNPDILHGLHVDDVLFIPKNEQNSNWKDSDVTDREDSSIENNVVEKRELLHKVAVHETLFSISKQYGIEVEKIKEWNPELQNAPLRVGQELIVGYSNSTSNGNKDVLQSNINLVAGDNNIFYYQIDEEDTFWQLENKFDVSRQELIDLNPILSEGLLQNAVIKVPNRLVSPELVNLNKSLYFSYRIEEGDNLILIAENNNTSISEIKQLNPQLYVRNLVVGEVINVPKGKVPNNIAISNKGIELNGVHYDVISSTPKSCLSYDFHEHPSYDIALFLPLYYSKNISQNQPKADSSNSMYNPVEGRNELIDKSVFKESPSVYKKSRNFMFFYEGILLAMDSLKEIGVNINLHVYDTNKDASVIQNILKKPEMKKMDLIIGPVYPNVQSQVASFALENNIAIVSPLSSDDRLTLVNKNYYQITPSYEDRVKATINLLIDRYHSKNILILNDEEKTNPKVIEKIKGKLSSISNDSAYVTRYNELDFKKEGISGVKSLLREDIENIIVLPSKDEAEIIKLFAYLAALPNKYKITILGMMEWSKFSNIPPERYHKMNFTYLSFYDIDYSNNNVKTFVRKFRQNFGTEPNSYSFQGYDIMLYFGYGLKNFGSHFRECLSYLNVELLQSKYNFIQKSSNGGFVNNALFMLKYDREFQLENDGIINQFPIIRIPNESNNINWHGMGPNIQPQIRMNGNDN